MYELSKNDLIKAVEERHSVRKYLPRPIEEGKLSILGSEIARINLEKEELNIQLVTEEPRCFSAGLLKYGAFRGVRNYIVMAGRGEAEELVGYEGEWLVLVAQSLGLNTCWVGLTYKKIAGTFQLRDKDKVHCVIALGYGEEAGKQHPQKAPESFYECDGPLPGNFKEGLRLSLLAPTAVNQQKFHFTFSGPSRVHIEPLFSMAGYTMMDLGIVKRHFEIGAGKESFEWV